MKKIFFLGISVVAYSMSISQTNILPSTGHAGIGTTNPNSPLEIATTLTPGANVFKFSNSQQSDQILFRDRDYAKFLNGIQSNKLFLGIPGNDDKIMSSTNSGNNIVFWPTLSINSTSNIIINPFQFVGIGTNSPQQALDVNGNIQSSASILAGSKFTLNGSTGNFQNTSWAGTANRILLTDALGNVSPLAIGGTNQVLYGNGSWGNLPAALSFFSVNANAVYVSNTTSLGVGTNNPQYPLDVNGDARISNNLYVGGGIVITDHVKAAESVTTSVLQADSIKMGTARALYGTTRVEGDLVVAPTRTVVAQGDILANSKLSVNGNVTFNGGLKLSSFVVICRVQQLLSRVAVADLTRG